MNDDTLTPELRAAMIEYLIATQALAGVTITREQAAEAVDSAYSEPLIDLTRQFQHDRR